MLDNNKIQYIGKIENSNNVVIINGNLTIDGQISKDLQTSCLEILRTDFDKYTTTAIEQAKQEIEECIKSILEKLAKEQQKHLTERFQSLSMQAFLHDTLIEYISTEDKRAKEFIIDVLIDRLNFQNISTEKAILNEAIKLIPNLNASTSALITFMMLRQQMVNPSISFMLELFFKQLSPIVDIYNPQIQISAESETKRSIFREKDKTKRSKKESAQHSKSRNKSFVMTSVSAL